DPDLADRPAPGGGQPARERSPPRRPPPPADSVRRDDRGRTDRPAGLGRTEVTNDLPAVRVGIGWLCEMRGRDFSRGPGVHGTGRVLGVLAPAEVCRANANDPGPGARPGLWRLGRRGSQPLSQGPG